MHTRSPRIGLLLAVLALLASAAIARAAGLTGGASRIVVPARVMAGESVELSWIAPEGAEELELELSLDDGRTWSRVTPELPGAVQAWSWRVPEVASTSARLRLRVGTEHGEYDLEPGEAFHIDLPAGAPARPWVRPRIEGSAALPRALSPPRSRIEEAGSESRVDSPTRLSVTARAPRGCESSERAEWRAPRPVAPDIPAAPRFVPLRN